MDAELRQRALNVAADQDGILSRRQLRDLDVHRHHVRTQVGSRKWQRPTANTVAVFTGELTARQRWWVALLETGCADAALDGVTALKAAGLVGYESTTTISCPHGNEPRRPTDVEVRVTRWRRPGDHITTGIPRVRPAAAAVHGALWARTDRQAALILVLAVQQRLTTGIRLQEALTGIGRHPRRGLTRRLVADIADGAQALGELDLAALCREYGLPKPKRQALRRGPNGRVYLDVYFDDYSLVVEIDGIHHLSGINQVDDALRQNELMLSADAVLRIPLLGLRIQPAAFMAQLLRALHDRGWEPSGVGASPPSGNGSAPCALTP